MNIRALYTSILTVAFLMCHIPIASAATFNVAGVRLTKDVKPLREIKRSNVISQSLDFSCGAAGLSTLLNFYLNDEVSEQEIIETLLTVVPIEKVRQRKGFSLFDLKTFAENRGYKVTGYQMDFEFLKNLDAPVLVPIHFRNYSH
ncbi:MAG TPA: cysteine peptidase family C39 domain-containing protein, partial [Candidatus Omnitrophota bacterium]|nr:cysteine peptidase family C39 domain-containing protein [Candidatus Omnitrophota bacterium]